MSLKVADVDRVHRKLEMEIREGKDRLAFFVYEGKRVISTKRSHGRGDIAGRIGDFIRQQMKVSESQFRGLVDCSVTRNDYIQILRDKGILPESPAEGSSER
jgi:hypothetical protein